MKNFSESLAVIGCGTMGHTIALDAAIHGMPVKLAGTDIEDLKRAWQGIDSAITTLIENDFINAKQAAAIKSLINTVTSVEEAIDNASMIIEAVPEEIHLKKKLFKRLAQLSDNSTILASNTSGLDPADISDDIRFPERFVITHFWNPAHLIPLVEVTGNGFTSQSTFDRVATFLQKMNKKVVFLKKYIPGFIGNRLQFALFREAQYLLDEGIASPEDIDAAVTFGIGRRLPVTGPLASADLGGLDVLSSISTYLFPVLSNASAPFPALQQLVREKKLGYKNGEGYYKWNKGDSNSIHKAREQELIGFLKKDRETTKD